MIELDDNDYVIHEKLNKEQAKMFCAFLIQERARHKEDIKKIDSTLYYLQEKHSF
jgi:hypothetical protein